MKNKKTFKFSKKYIIIAVCLIIVIGIAVAIGMSKKGTYTNALDNMDKLDVSLKSSLNKELAEELYQLIPYESQYVLKVKVLEEPTFDFQTVTHKVKVLEVFKGDDVKVGEEIVLFNANYHYFEDRNHMNLYNVNLMKKGDEYLVFIRSKEKTELQGEYFYIETYVVTPYFNYKNKDNVIVEDSSTEYGNVKNNEFIVNTQYELEIFMEFKKMMMEKYDQTATD